MFQQFFDVDREFENSETKEFREMNDYLTKKLRYIWRLNKESIFYDIQTDNMCEMISIKVKAAKYEYSGFLERSEENAFNLNAEQKMELESCMSVIVLYDVYTQLVKCSTQEFDMYKMKKVLEKSYKTSHHRCLLDVLFKLYNKFFESKLYGTAKYFLLMIAESAKYMKYNTKHSNSSDSDSEEDQDIDFDVLDMKIVDMKLFFLEAVLLSSSQKLNKLNSNLDMEMLDRNNEDMLKLLQKEFPNSDVSKFPSRIKDFEEANNASQQILKLCEENDKFINGNCYGLRADQKAKKTEMNAYLPGQVYLQSAKFQKDEFVQAKLLQKAIDFCAKLDSVDPSSHLLIIKLNLMIDESYTLLWRVRQSIYLNSSKLQQVESDGHLKKLKATIVKRINHGSKIIKEMSFLFAKKKSWPILFDLCKASQILEDQERAKTYANQLSRDLELNLAALEDFKTKIGLVGPAKKCSQGTLFKIIIKSDPSCVPYC